ncbi:MAG: hypothetical protein V4658_05875 [Bacteroidota bacterium]
MKYIVSLFILISLAACQMGKFDRYPGKVQNAFPATMRGTYYFVIPAKFKSATSGIKEGDTILYVITENTISVIDTAGKRTQKTLDKNQVLTLVEGKYYVVSARDKDYKKYWNCMVYEGDKKTLSIYPSIDETRKTSLHKYFGREFIGLNESKDSVYAYKMDDKAFVNYFKKELKSDPIKLKRLN